MGTTAVDVWSTVRGLLRRRKAVVVGAVGAMLLLMMFVERSEEASGDVLW